MFLQSGQKSLESLWLLTISHIKAIQIRMVSAALSMESTRDLSLDTATGLTVFLTSATSTKTTTLLKIIV